MRTRMYKVITNAYHFYLIARLFHLLQGLDAPPPAWSAPQPLVKLLSRAAEACYAGNS